MKESAEIKALRGRVAELEALVDQGRRANQMLLMQRDLALRLTSTSDLAEALAIGLEAALSLEGLEAGGIYLFDEEGRLVIESFRGFSSELIQGVKPIPPEDPRAVLVKKGRPVYSTYPKLAKGLEDELRQEGIRALGVIPITHGGGVVGCMNLGSRRLDEFPALARPLAETIAANIGSTIARLRLSRRTARDEAIFEQLVEHLHIPVSVMDLAGNYLYFNAKNEEIFGYTKENTPNLEAWARQAFDDEGYRAKVIKAYRWGVKAAAAGELMPQLFDVRCRDGSLKKVVFRILARHENEVFLSAEDLTGLIEADERIRTSEERYRLLSELTSDFAYLVRGAPGGPQELVWGGRALGRALGYYPKGFFDAQKIMEVLLPESRSVFLQGVERLKQGEPINVELGMWKPDGQTAWVRLRAQRYKQEGDLVYIIGAGQDITERKMYERALKESEERYRVISQLSTDFSYSIFIDADQRQKLEWETEAFERITGYRLGDLMDKGGLTAIAHPKSKAGLEVAVQDLLNRKATSGELRIIDKQGLDKWLYIDCLRTDIGQGSDGFRLIGAGRDITAQKQTDRALRRSERKFRTISELTNDFAFSTTVDANGEAQVEWETKAVTELLGMSVAEYAGKYGLDRFASVVAPDSQGELDRRNRLMTQGRPSTVILHLRNHRGLERWVRMITRPERDEPSGIVRRVVVVGQDITEIKGQQEALRESEEKYRALFEDSGDAVLVTGPEGRIQDANHAATALFDFARQDMLGRDIGELFEDRSMWEELTRLADEKGSIQGHGARMVTRSGRFMETLISATARKDKKGQGCGYQGIIRDVTEVTQIWKALEESEARHRLVSQISSDFSYCLTYWKGEGLTLEWETGAIERITGYTRAEIMEMGGWRKIAHPDSDEALARRWEKISKGQSVAGDYRILARDGRDVWVHLFNHSQVIEGEKKSLRLVVSGKDITGRKKAELEIKRMEKQLVQAQKMEAVGTLASGIAHDFNNILQVISGYAHLVLAQTADDSQEAKYLEEVLKNIKRAADLVRRLLTFSRKVEADLIPLRLNDAVREGLSVLGRLLPKMIEIKPSLDPGLGLILGDPNQINQIIINLGVNAKDAMPDGGVIEISTKAVILDAGQAAASGAKPGPYAVLRFSDTGEGIRTEDKAKIFDPFFTTKGVGQGTGLGLSMVYGIMKSYGGFVDFQSEPGQGASFELYFPATGRASVVEPGQQDPAMAQPPAALTGAVLIIDDEEALVEIGKAHLSRQGFEVFTAASGEQGVEVYKAHAGEIDVVVLDLGMPGMGGARCLAEIMAFDPQAKVVVASGYAVAGMPPPPGLEQARAFLGKPFTMNELLGLITNLIE